MDRTCGTTQNQSLYADLIHEYCHAAKGRYGEPLDRYVRIGKF